MSDRFIVRETRGTPVTFAYQGVQRITTEITVMDSWYGYMIVWRAMGGGRNVADSRRMAQRRCDRWNAEHEAALQGEEAQALKGAGSR